jgi:hypothetical protein
MSGARRAPGPLTALAVTALAVLAMAAPASGAQETQEPRLPRELWKTYPLDPTRGETGEQSTGSGGTSESRPPAAPSAGRAPRETPQADGGASVTVLLAAVGGLAGLLAVGFAVVIARRRGRLLPRRLHPRRAVMAWGGLGAAHSVRALAVVSARRLADAGGTVRPPRPRMPQRLRSETGSLVPLAEPSAREKRIKPPEPERVSPGEAPPKKKPLPGLAPPPAKERQVRSGLPPWKRVPYPAEAPLEQEPTPSAPEPARPAAPLQPLYTAGRVEPRRPGRRTAGARGRAEECEIEWWRGSVMSDFYAFALRPGGTTTVLARSPSFRWRPTDPPRAEGPAAEAHAALVERLAAEGWESVGTRAAWYRTQLHRRHKPTLRDFADSAGRGAC